MQGRSLADIREILRRYSGDTGRVFHTYPLHIPYMSHGRVHIWDLHRAFNAKPSANLLRVFVFSTGKSTGGLFYSPGVTTMFFKSSMVDNSAVVNP